MNALTPWAVSASAELAGNSPVLFELHADPFNFKVIATTDSIWIETELPNGGRVSFRTAYSPGSSLEVVKSKENPQQRIDLKLKSAIGQQKVCISIDQTEGSPILRYTTNLIPSKETLMPNWPKDVLFTGKDQNPENTAGKIHAGQFGTRTGFLYLTETRPKSATLLYFQNLTALSVYCEQTESSLGDTVGGEWPELGFSLPPSKKPLKAGKEVTLCDAFVAFSEEVPEDYPTSGFNARKGKNISFNVLGDERINCRLILAKTAQKKIPEFEVLINGQKEPLKASTVANGNLEYIIPGNSSITVHTQIRPHPQII